ncbi:kinase-like domain-containing protein [Trichoderma aethiopicum]
MTSRSSFRGGYNPAYSHQSHHSNDPRGYSQSPQNPGSFHNSPSPSPYGAGRGGWSGHQYSPQQQYPPHYAHASGGYAPAAPPQNGSQNHYHVNPLHSPPYAAPTGPQASFRGGHRGSGFRGTSFANRGSYRGSAFQSTSRNPASQAPPPPPPPARGNGFPSDEEGDRRPNAADADTGTVADTEATNAPESASQAPSDDAPSAPANQTSTSKDNAEASSQSAPKLGSGGGKFSFAFKPSSKPTPTAPKPEISQKFNAPPKREPPPQTQSANRDREPPPSAPTEPSSARSRREFRHPPEGPKMAPRTRKVTKIMKRPKPRPTLPPDLIDSDSVFFRKPGNESVVGSGTYGKVFKGLNVYTKGLVALKRIRMEGERDGFPVTAVREIKLLQSLRHTNIVRLQEVMVEKNDCFMVFEYLSHDLTGLLNHPSFSLDPAQKKHMAKQLFEGLDYLHERGVLHRDIKAANILVSSDGILKLADFGLARFYAKRHQLDYTNRVITIWYRSPELLLGETKYTAAVDVWSAACVMVEIFTRLAIFAGDGTELSQLEKIYNTLGTPTRQDWPGITDMAWFELLRPTAKRKSIFAEKYKDRVSPAAFDLLQSMFQYDPAKRPTASMVLQHPYFTTEEPLPRQAVELANIGGDWHEFESKALRKENERRDREARKAAKDATREKDKKRVTETHDRERSVKRIHVDQKSADAGGGTASTVEATKE